MEIESLFVCVWMYYIIYDMIILKCFSLDGKSVHVQERKWVWTGSFVRLLLLVFSDPAQPKHIKGNAKHSCSRVVSLLPWQDYSGEYLFWGAGHANCRPRCMQGESSLSCQKQHVSVLTMSCFQRERGGSAKPKNGMPESTVLWLSLLSRRGKRKGIQAFDVEHGQSSMCEGVCATNKLLLVSKTLFSSKGRVKNMCLWTIFKMHHLVWKKKNVKSNQRLFMRKKFYFCAPI